MLDKIVLSRDRHSATVHFDTHSVHFHSDKDVMDLVYEIIIEPAMRLQRRWEAAQEDTVEIDLNLDLYKGDAA